MTKTNSLKSGLILMFLMGLLFSCGSSSESGGSDSSPAKADPLVGTWQATEIKMGENMVPAEQTAGVVYTFAESTYEIKRGDDVSKGTWQYSHDKNAVLLIYDGSTKTYDVNLRIKDKSDSKITFSTYTEDATYGFDAGSKSLVLTKK